MSDFPSLNKLMAQSSSTKPVSDDSVEGKFARKMKQVGDQEKEIETQRYAQMTGVPYINLEKFPIAMEALKQVPREVSEQLGVVCFFYESEQFRLGAVDPTQEGIQELMKEMEEKAGSKGAIYVISAKSFERVFKLYETMPVVKAISKDIEVSTEALEAVQADITDFSSFQALLKRANTSDIMVYIIGAALKLGCTDLHIEAEENRVLVRFRLDGILHDGAELPNESYKQLVSRVKLTSSLKMNITEKPQDGRFTIKTKDSAVDVRVSTLPTVYGESIVMRLLPQNREGVKLESLGLRGRVFEELNRQIQRPSGMIITTGPTGSGKTTTLYSVMHILNEPGVKILTLEDPVEYKMAGINQSQIDLSKDYTFAKGLRSMLRQDPDIAMVGEIRDLETADIAIQAALTGHLILSTIHTNSAAGAIPRFLSMGVKPFLLAPALNAVIGQRLIRKLCQECKAKVELTADEQTRVASSLDALPEAEKNELIQNFKYESGKVNDLVFYDAKGCKACNGIGYKGRVGIYEIMVMNKEIEMHIQSGKVSEYDLDDLAVKQGMVKMVQDGILKALEGKTSVAEVFRIIE
jgi:type IV pilus assembly protein PilB